MLRVLAALSFTLLPTATCWEDRYHKKIDSMGHEPSSFFKREGIKSVMYRTVQNEPSRALQADDRKHRSRRVDTRRGRHLKPVDEVDGDTCVSAKVYQKRTYVPVPVSRRQTYRTTRGDTCVSAEVAPALIERQTGLTRIEATDASKKKPSCQTPKARYPILPMYSLLSPEIHGSCRRAPPTLRAALYASGEDEVGQYGAASLPDLEPLEGSVCLILLQRKR